MFNYSYANSYGNLGTYGRSSVSVGLGRVKPGAGAITRTFNFCNLTAPDLQFAFACTFGSVDPCPRLPKNTPYQKCSPWPHFGGLDNSNSRYSPILGTQTGNVNTINSSFINFVAQTSSSIAADGTIYTGYNLNTNDLTQGYLISFNSNGSIKWYYKLIDNDFFLKSNPTIGPNGNIYFGSNSGYVYAINPNGNLIWKRAYTGDFKEKGITNVPLSINGSVVIANNALYFGGNYAFVSGNVLQYGLTNLLAANITDGSIIFKYAPLSSVPEQNRTNLSDCGPFIRKDVAIDKNNNIYFCYQYESEPPFPYFRSNLVSITSQGVERFSKPLVNGSTMISYPVLSIDNSITYISSYEYRQIDSKLIYHLTAINNYNNGIFNEQGSINLDNSQYLITPVLQTGDITVNEGSLARDSNDYIYMLIKNTLYKLKDKRIIWKFDANTIGATPSYPTSSPIIGSDGTVYFPTTVPNENQLYTSYLYAVNSNGTLKWKTQLPQLTANQSVNVFNSPAMKSNGNIILHTTIQTGGDINSGLYEFS
jgi:outer membrane protein assembly factor BamB